MKSKNEKVVRTAGAMPYTMHTYSYTKMYKRTQFSMNVGVQNVQNYFSSKYRPNILTVPITIRASGIVSEIEYEKYLEEQAQQGLSLNSFDIYGLARYTT
jgi:hypothetical protein